MTKAFTPNSLFCYLDATAITNDPFVPNALVFATGAFPITNGPKNLFTEETITFGSKGTIVDGFRLENFAVRPAKDIIR